MALSFPISEETPAEHIANALMILACAIDRGQPNDQLEIVDREDLLAIQRRLHKAMDQLNPAWRGRRPGDDPSMRGGSTR